MTLGLKSRDRGFFPIAHRESPDPISLIWAIEKKNPPTVIVLDVSTHCVHDTQIIVMRKNTFITLYLVIGDFC